LLREFGRRTLGEGFTEFDQPAVFRRLEECYGETIGQHGLR
jgi:hypothetical protein